MDEMLSEFVAYCRANPEQRFWQALRNWSGHDFILARDRGETEDTFYWHGKQGPGTGEGS